MRNPIRILVESRSVEIVHLEPVSRVEDGLHAVFLFHDVKPCLHGFPELRPRQAARLFHVQHGRQVARLQMHLFQEEKGLPPRVDVGKEEVVSAPDEVVLLGFVKVQVEVFVQQSLPFGGFDEHETDGRRVQAGVAQQLPVDVFLIVRHVDAMHVEAFRIHGIAINGLPAPRRRVDEEMIKESNVGHRQQHSARPDGPRRPPPEEQPLVGRLFPLAACFLPPWRARRRIAPFFARPPSRDAGFLFLMTCGVCAHITNRPY